MANTSARLRAGRIVLVERSGRGDAGEPTGVSVRATGVVRRALAASRTPVRYVDLADRLVAETPGADRHRVESLLDELLRQTLLLTDLRPPLTVADRASWVLDRLAGIAAAVEPSRRLQAVLTRAAEFDAGQATAERYRDTVSVAATLGTGTTSPLQVDSRLRFAAGTIGERVADEAVRAAELLLRMSPTPHGPAHLAGYRRLFEQRYGHRGEVPVLELLDPNTGLGPPPAATAGRLDTRRSADRSAALIAIATAALRDRTPCVELDDALVRRLESADPTEISAPLSLELAVSIAAASAAALDRGEFELVVGASVGSSGAGRMLGRFADLVPGAERALRRTAEAEALIRPGTVSAELSYAPRSARQANVATRLHPQPYEIAVAVPSGADPAHTIPVDELLVGVRDGRLRLRWSVTGDEVVITAGHMLNPAQAPLVARFLSEIGRDGVCQLGGFAWGPVGGFPYLPRIRAGRSVLSLAQWRLTATELAGGEEVTDVTDGQDVLADPDRFRRALDRWRRRWDAPVRLALVSGDRRLALDLDRPADTAELRRSLRHTHGPVTLTELYPDSGDLWLVDTDDQRFAAELVVPLIRRAADPPPPVRPAAAAGADRGETDLVRRPPGSDWLFVKLYTGPDLEDDLLVDGVRVMVADAAVLGIPDWFFLRYGDPERHIRLRFRGDPDRLLTVLLPRLTGWAAGHMAAGLCRRFAIDTYEREIDRFGGPDGTTAAEAFFGADSAATLELLAVRAAGEVSLEPVPLAVVTIDALLTGFGVELADRAQWCAARGGPRRESGGDYRRFKATLRPLLSAPSPVAGPVGAVQAALRDAAATLRAELDRLAADARLAGAPADLLPSLTHLHLNRLISADQVTERRVYGLLGRLYAGLLAVRPGH